MIPLITQSPPVKRRTQVIIQTTIEPNIKCNNQSCAFQCREYCKWKDAHLKWVGQNQVICTKYQPKKNV